MIFVYVTTPDAALAKELAQTVVKERLAACANILPGMQSIYEWQGRLEASEECVVILKTRESLFKPLAERLQALHRYECPCIVSWKLDQSFAPYLEWLEQQTEPQA